MALIFSTNNRLYGTAKIGNYFPADVGIFKFKEFMKANGWAVPQSCDGYSFNQNGNDVITNANSGFIGGIGGQSTSNSAWFILRSPDGIKEFLFCRPANFVYNNNAWHYTWLIGYSAKSKFSTTTGLGGNAISISNPPSAIDGVWLADDAFTPGALFSKVNYTESKHTVGLTSSDTAVFWNIHFCVNNESPYDWYILATKEPSPLYQKTMTFIMYESLNNLHLNDNECYQTLSYSKRDASGYFFEATNSTWSSTYWGLPNKRLWANKADDYASRSSFWDNVSLYKSDFCIAYCTTWWYSDDTNNRLLENGTTQNGKTILLPILFDSGSRFRSQIKGVGNIVKASVSKPKESELLNVNSTNDYFHIYQNICIPWSGEVLNTSLSSNVLALGAPDTTSMYYWNLDGYTAPWYNKTACSSINFNMASGASIQITNGLTGNSIKNISGNGLVSTLDNFQYLFSQDYSFSFWVKLNSYTNNGCIFSKNFSQDNEFGTAFDISLNNNNDGYFYFGFSTIANDDVIAYSANMSSDPGWTLDAGWAYGTPTGSAGDPSSGYTGSSVIGYNLSGAYQNSMTAKNATTPAINCSGITNTKLRFRRWLGIEASPTDTVLLQISTNGSTWTNLWSNPSNNIVETTWHLQEFSIASIADNQPVVYIRWVIGPTSGSTTYCGWNIDDVQVYGSPTSNILATRTAFQSSDIISLNEWTFISGTYRNKIFNLYKNARLIDSRSFAFTPFLCHFDGANDSTTIIDDGYFNLTPTVAGNAKLSTSQSKFGGASLYLNGVNTSKVSFDVTNKLAFSHFDFCIEGWFYPRVAITGYTPLIVFCNNADGQGPVLYTETTTHINFIYSINGTSWLEGINTGLILPHGEWTHLAVVRNGSTINIFKNGLLVKSSTTVSTNTLFTSNTLWIGHYPYFPGGARTFDGYIDEVRITIGNYVYSGNYFDLQPYAHVKTNQIKDLYLTSSKYNLLGSVANNNRVDGCVDDIRVFNTEKKSHDLTAFYRYPLSLITCKKHSLTSFLCHFDGANDSTTIVDDGYFNFSSTVAGNAKLSTSQSKFGGASLYLDGVNTSKVSFTITDKIKFGANDFCIEGWFYPRVAITGYTPLITFSNTADAQGPSLYTETNTRFYFNYSKTGSGWAESIDSGVILQHGEWTHLAVVRVGNTTNIFRNGLLVKTSTTVASDAVFTSNTLWIGHYPYFSGGARTFDGYIDEVRITTGSNIYADYFDVQTSQHSYTRTSEPSYDLSNKTVFLTHGEGNNNSTTLIDDGIFKLPLIFSGNAKISTTQYKFGSSSLYLDGNDSSKIKTQNMALWSNNDFCIEGWFYPAAAISGYTPLLMFTSTDVDAQGPVLYTETSSRVYFDYSLNGTSWNEVIDSGVSLDINNWNHLAVTRNGNTINIFKNGTLVKTTSVIAGNIVYTSSFLYLGHCPWLPVGKKSFNGYIDEVRVVTGVPIYTASFTPSNSAYSYSISSINDLLPSTDSGPILNG